MLHPDPALRPSAEALLHHPFLEHTATTTTTTAAAASATTSAAAAAAAAASSSSAAAATAATATTTTATTTTTAAASAAAAQPGVNGAGANGAGGSGSSNLASFVEVDDSLVVEDRRLVLEGLLTQECRLPGYGVSERPLAFRVSLARPLGLLLGEVARHTGGGLSVDEIREGGSAEACGALREGDRLVAVGEKSLRGLGYDWAMKLLQSGGETVDCLFERACGADDECELPTGPILGELTPANRRLSIEDSATFSSIGGRSQMEDSTMLTTFSLDVSNGRNSPNGQGQIDQNGQTQIGEIGLTRNGENGPSGQIGANDRSGLDSEIGPSGQNGQTGQTSENDETGETRTFLLAAVFDGHRGARAG